MAGLILFVVFITFVTFIVDGAGDTTTMGDCSSCKHYIKSFNHWLEKTSRSKFEGGDVAWEEAKLKSYSRSEVRLAELQESVCSELKSVQDKCYSVAEEAEDFIEDWWKMEITSDKMLYSWLCIDKLKYCCPKYHYGKECMPCLGGLENVCSGNGKCKGDGTRKGSGECVCNAGYSGSLCNECLFNYYKSSITETDIVCRECDKSCTGCHNEGPGNCEKCSNGFILHENTCLKEIELNNSYVRYVTYFGLCFAVAIILRRSRNLAGIFGILIALYISLREYILHTKQEEFDSDFKFIDLRNFFSKLPF